MTSPITSLRDIVPLRPLRYLEAIRLAEFQAQRFLAMNDITAPSVPERIIRDLPKLHVARLSPFPVSGASHWSNGRWLVAINGSEPTTRQRFSLAHEFKHIIDHRFARLTYSAFPEADRHQMIEQVCDYFAGCLLMPRPWVKRLYFSGINEVPNLATTFGVSQAAMTVRLQQIGLVQATPRCQPISNADWTRHALRDLHDRPIYQRVASYAT
jgi:Zn-dependent peptidase ImmA (M78 family)